MVDEYLAELISVCSYWEISLIIHSAIDVHVLYLRGSNFLNNLLIINLNLRTYLLQRDWRERLGVAVAGYRVLPSKFTPPERADCILANTGILQSHCGWQSCPGAKMSEVCFTSFVSLFQILLHKNEQHHKKTTTTIEISWQVVNVFGLVSAPVQKKGTDWVVMA